ncbi:SusC/RagA family TonB-linked outer membrane protein [Longitalea luteola]|uniref:SusC/RagA family TonB-linked outer membrane protein n=1 Tax=Longitalea luteola TaxID=2812563 RepID=UPI001A96A28A|nr:TonB-dependent receptor [Longitalea luteola]
MQKSTTKTLIVMKIVFMLCTIATMNAYAFGYSQTVTFSGRDVPLRNVFAVIRQQTGYSLFCNKQLLQSAQPVTVNAREMPLSLFMANVLKHQPLNFRIDDKTIILSEKPEEKPAPPAPLKKEQRQDKIVTGRITDEKGEPLGGATVTVKGTNETTLTKEDGTFRLRVPEGRNVLVVSHVGMASQEINVAGKTMVAVALTSLNNNMNDVIVIGYGTQKRYQSTGAVASIKAAEVQDIPAPNIAGTLRGRIAGLGVSSASGRPGSSITLNVRNSTTSDAGNLIGATPEPLYVIDNIIVDKASFDALDPSMVEDITVLKDASAAIYGAAGAKGVILITTKRGQAGQAKVSYNGYYGTTDATKKPEMLSAYDHALLLNDTYKMNNADPKDFFSEEDLEYIRGLNYASWFDELWQPSYTQRHNLSVSGGSDRLTYFVGGSYQNENGNYAGIKVDKYSFRSGLNARLAKGLKADINFNVDHNIRYSENEISENDQNFLADLVQIPRWVPTQINGQWVNHDNMNKHPLAMIASGYYRTQKNRGYRINAAMTWQPESGFLKGLTARFQVSQGGSNSDGDEYRPPYTLYNFHRLGNNQALYSDSATTPYVVNAADRSRLGLSLGNNNSYQGFLTLQYARSFARHNFSVLVGGEQSRSYSKSVEAEYFNQQIPNFDQYWAFDLNSDNVRNPVISEATKRSFFGRLSYNFDGKYTLEGITRFDASSNFARGNIWGVFPSIGLGWIVSQEDFFRDNVKFIDYMKLRLNYGLTGDDRVNKRLWQERFRADIQGYLYGNNYVAGLKPDVIPNPDITWEKRNTINVGAEIALLDNKLSIGVDVFRNHIYDAFDQGANDMFPMYVGFAMPVVNYQVRYAWGSEWSIGYKTQLARDLHIRANMNFSFSNSVIERMFYNPYDLWQNMPEDWIIGLGTDPRKYNSSNFGLIYQGMFRTQEEVDAFLAKNPNYTIDEKVPQPGWMYYKDLNGDGKITDVDKTTMFNRVDPWLATGIQLGLTYKSFTMNVNIAARFGGKEFIDSRARRSEPTESKNVPAFWTDRWSPDNPDGRYPRTDDPSLGWESDIWAVDGTMIRINDMTIAYSIPERLTKKAGLSNARILATGNNLWTLKNPLKYKDPYQSYIYDYPTLRTMSVGLSLGL